jgi:hypothetical protein
MTVTKAKPRPKLQPPKKPPASPVAIGIDLSPSSLAGSAKMFDATLRQMTGPVFTLKRWPKGTPDFEKLLFLSKGHEIIYDLLHQLGGIAAIEDIFIGVEEVPPVKNTSRIREQSMLVGCFVGSLLRYGYNVQFVHNRSWQSLVAADMDVRLVKDEFDKWTVKNWARTVFDDIPNWKDLIRNGKEGLIPKPKGSKAMPAQPDDRYDSLGIMTYVWDRHIPAEKHERPKFKKEKS